jgi:parallel beta-helix repeat protein
VITSNIISNGIGAPEGTPGGAYSGANGIFLDDCSQNAEVSNNTIFDCHGLGLFMRANSSVQVRGNTIFNNGEGQLSLTHNHGLCLPRNNTIENNIFVSKQPTQFNVKYESDQNDLGSYGQFDRNVYSRPFEDVFKIFAVYNPGSGVTGSNLSLADWQSRFGKDPNSTNSPVTYKSYTITGTGATKLNNAFSGGTDGWSTWSNYGNGQASGDNSNKLDGGSLRIGFGSASNRGDSYVLASNPIGSVNNGKTYLLKFDAVASGGNKRVEVFLRQKTGSYRDLDTRSVISVGTSRQNYEMTFTANADEGDAILVMQVPEDGQTLWVDNLTLQEATKTANNPDDFVKLAYNDTGDNKQVGLDGTYKDARNNVYNNSVTVAPFSSVVLYKVIGTTPTQPQPQPSTLRDPENPSNAVAGLDYKYYEGSWSNIPNYDALTPNKTGTVGSLDLSIRNRDENFGVSFKGYVNIPADGQYTFYTTSDDGSKLLIGTTEVVNNDGMHGDQERSGTIGLKAGKHAISILFLQGGGGRSLTVSYSGPNLNKQAIQASAYFRVGTTTTQPQPSTSTPTTTYLSDMTWTSATNGYGPVEKDRSNGESGAGDGRTITLNGTPYAKGLGVHGQSEIVYNLGGKYNTFLTDIGIDDELNGTCGSVEFQVYLDNVLVYNSGTMTPTSATKSVSLDVSGKQTLKLVVTNAGDGSACDHGDWAGARVISNSGARLAASFDEFKPEVTVQVYPIPARDVMQVRYYAQADGELTLQLVSTAAQPVLSSNHPVVTGENLIKIPVGEVGRGFYVLTLTQGQHRITRKVILAE